MSTTPTTNYAWLKPDNGTELDLWGPIENTITDNIDSVVKAVSNVANQAATDAAAALAAVGGSPQMTISEQTFSVSSGLSVAATAATPFFLITLTGGLLTVTLSAGSLAVSKAVEKTMVLVMSGSSAITFVAGSGVSAISLDIAGAGNGKNLYKVYWYRTAGGTTTALVKRIGSVSP